VNDIQNSDATHPQHHQARHRWREASIFLLLALAIWVPRTLALDQFVTADEPFWLTRSANFNCALGQGELSNTFQSEHPGVTIMWAGTLGFRSQFPTYHQNCRNLSIGELELYLQEVSVEPIDLLAAGRFFSVLGITLLLLLAYHFAKQILGPVPALVGFLLIAFDPFYTAHTRVLHLDGMLTTLMLLALLAFICYLQKRTLSALLISGAAAGLSWLTKSPGFFIIPAAGLLGLIDFIWKSRAAHEKLRLDRFIKELLWPLLLLGGIGAASFTLFWPAMWADPVGTLSKIVDAALNYAESAYGTSRVFFDGVIIDSGKLGWDFYYFYPLNYLWRSTPIVLTGLLGTLLAFIPLKRAPQPKTPQQKETQRVLVGIFLFACLFTLAMTTGTKKFDRYQLPVYPALDLAAAVGWVEIAKWVKSKFSGSKTEGKGSPRITYYASSLILGCAIILQASGTFQTAPYYFSYYNPWMGGPQGALDVMLIGRGEGIEQAAHYLNQQPNAEQLTVRSWYNRGSFSYFFKGASESLPSGYQWSKDQVRDVLSADYVVIYVHQWQRKMPERFLDYLTPQTPVFSFSKDGIDYVQVYKIEQDTALYKDPAYTETNAMLADQILLKGYGVLKREVTPGETLPLALSWQTVETPEERLKVFIHILSNEGTLAAQSDAEPVFWLRPTDGWDTGETLVDRYYIPLPETMPPGDYTIMAGMYRPSGERLPITQEGTPQGDALNLGQITVRPAAP